MTTLREKVARALCRFAFADKACRSESALCATCRGEADAAIAAVFEHLAEPSEAMVDAGAVGAFMSHHDQIARVTWDRMLATARKEAGL